MTDIKRNISDVLETSASPEPHEDKRLHTKPGRKPVETEPKSKRTAQNRAAQRAYRERKERKMKDLEDKVKILEDDNVRAATEADFLKAQVDMLKKELIKYRGGNADFSDLNLPPSKETFSSVQPRTNPRKSDSTSSISTKSSISTGPTSSSVSSPHNNFSFDFPWSKENLKSHPNSVQQRQLQQSQLLPQDEQIPDLVSGSSSSTSPLNDNLLVSPESSIESSINVNQDVNNNLDFTAGFDEQLDSFCAKLGEACGTRQQPIPKYKRNNSSTSSGSVVHQYNSPFSNLVTPNSNNYSVDYTNDPFFSNQGDFNFNISNPKDAAVDSAAANNTTKMVEKNDPLSFLNDNNFDVSLAFGDPSPGDELDPIAMLTTEESQYDPLTDQVNVNFNFNDFVKHSLPSESNYTTTEEQPVKVTTIPEEPEDDDDDDNVVVPAPAKTIKCSEIWDRITAHPKYTELDIDGLCNELKSKAKCSENGVVINSNDVNRLLEENVFFRH
ncbi:AP-1-like transcription factor CAP1 [Spathaspora sp. JA1]|nr:AP-1-like transcription factor CAP1 [Spathaspora sp. JA1]